MIVSRIAIVFSSIILYLCPAHSFGQQIDTIPETQLREVVIASSRIDVPIASESRTLQIISSETLLNSGATTLTEALAQLVGVDVRQRGVAGVQADLLIRGGGFDQTLLLIDGIKLDDSQTGHHTLNFVLPIQAIERVEIIKGPAARVYGQNAFTGAVNIVTKRISSNKRSIGVSYGSYNQRKVSATIENQVKPMPFILHADLHSSEGYRHNTDFNNQNYFTKVRLRNTKQNQVNLLGAFSSRNFGANGFYATPEAVDQYEETQASLLALKSVYSINNWKLKPSLFWRRGQDTYLFVRGRPDIYRNLHITNKFGFATDASLQSKLGVTGMGIDLSKVFISSNNLGQRNRTILTLFIEHRLSLLNGKVDFTPGLTTSNYSDFGSFFYPGIDLGVQLNQNLRFYSNIGLTYRIPTYTDLYYSDPTTLGNENLNPEEAFSQEIGLRYFHNDFQFYISVYNRNATNLIDYIKETQETLWQATNIRKLNTWGIETESNFGFRLGDQKQAIRVGYGYLVDDLKSIDLDFSRYSINSLKHQLSFNFDGRLNQNLFFYWTVRYAQREGDNGYVIADINASWRQKKWELSVLFNNIFNQEYSQVNMVPMPKGNGLISLNYKF